MTRILVTGASGFAGSHLVQHLQGRGELFAWTRSSPPGEIAGAATWCRLDLLDRERVRRELAELRPSVVYHCAGSPHVADSWREPSQALSGNVLTTHFLVDALRRADLGCRVVITGSAAVYAPSTSPLSETDALRPSSPYALSKLAQELLGLQATRSSRVEVILTRSFNHTGPRQSPAFVAPAFARQIALIERGALPPVMMVGNLDVERDFTDVRDTVAAYAQLAEHGTSGTVYNVASGIGRPLRSLLDGLMKRANAQIRVEVDPARLRPHDTPVLVGDPARIRQLIAWQPTVSLDRMLDDLLEFWRSEAARAQPRNA
jgi:GDP-4-dehydro-6-deoxy-D-mannose reductase